MASKQQRRRKGKKAIINFSVLPLLRLYVDTAQKHLYFLTAWEKKGNMMAQYYVLHLALC